METIRHQTSGGYTALPSGTVLDRYCIDSVIASGGFGITYLCHHTSLNKIFALKEHFPRQLAFREGGTGNIKPTDPDTFSWALDRFVQEGRSLAQCSHPNVVSVSDVFEANSTAYMVLGFEQGQSLKSWVSSLQRRPTQDEIDRFLVPLLAAMEYVHSKQMLHRDIAPDNIMIRDDGSPCLLDFGAARQAVAEKSQLMSAIVKSGFSPPEQYTRSGRSQGAWSDIYALSATLYWAVTGDAPQESTERVVIDDYEPLADRDDLKAKYRHSFLQAIDHGLKLKFLERPQSVSDWTKHLIHDQAPSTSATAKVDVEKEKSAKNISFTELPVHRSTVEPAKSPRSSMGIMMMIILALLVLGGGWFLSRNSTGDPSVQQSDVARKEAEFLKAKVERQAVTQAEATKKVAAGTEKKETQEFEANQVIKGDAEKTTQESTSPTTKSQLPECPKDRSLNFHNCFGSFSAPNGDKYIGEFKNNKFNGQGTFTFSDGKKYYGSFVDDKRNGQGVQTFLNGQKYVGEFKDDKPSGQGTQTFPNGDKYVGEFRLGNFHGFGIFYLSDGNIKQSGMWSNGNFLGNPFNTPFSISLSGLPSCPSDQSEFYHNCFGTFSTPDGAKYVGEFANNKTNGQGTTTFRSGEQHVGSYKDDKRYGQGSYRFSNGEFYTGEYKDGKPNGQGSYIFENGERYIGEYRNGKPNGVGSTVFASGAKYVGGYVDGKRNGFGTYIFPDGKKYIGEFKNDDSHGLGTLYTADGVVQQSGLWENDKFVRDAPVPKRQ